MYADKWIAGLIFTQLKCNISQQVTVSPKSLLLHSNIAKLYLRLKIVTHYLIFACQCVILVKSFGGSVSSPFQQGKSLTSFGIITRCNSLRLSCTSIILQVGMRADKNGNSTEYKKLNNKNSILVQDIISSYNYLNYWCVILLYDLWYR